MPVKVRKIKTFKSINLILEFNKYLENRLYTLNTIN